MKTNKQNKKNSKGDKMALKLKKLTQADLTDTPQAEMTQLQSQEAADSQMPLPSSETVQAPTHFDDLISAAPDAEPVSAVDTTLLNVDEFHKIFCLGFNVASSVTRLKSLAVDANDGAAKGCSAAIYETCLEIPALHFLLQPGGKWGGRILAIGAFVVPMSIGVKEELAERRKQILQSSIGEPDQSPIGDMIRHEI